MARVDFSRVDVQALLSRLGIEARRNGTRWVASCPSGRHVDAHPSWDIRDDPTDPRHGLHSCLSCGYSGTSVSLVADVIGISSAVALDWIVERAMGKPTPALRARLVIQSLTARTFSLPRDVHVAPLAAWPAEPRDYLLGRRIAEEQVDRWRLGYAIEGRLNGRIVIPTHDAAGRVVNYVARAYPTNGAKDIGNVARYYFPKREEGPDMGAVWGELHWPSVADRRALVVCEGAINGLAVETVLARARRADAAVGALSGSHVHLGQVMRCSTFPLVVVLTDRDTAGDNAATSLVGGLARHVEVRRVRLQRGDDPAAMLARGEDGALLEALLPALAPSAPAEV